MIFKPGQTQRDDQCILNVAVCSDDLHQTALIARCRGVQSPNEVSCEQP